MVEASQIISVIFLAFSRLQKTKMKALILILLSNIVNVVSLILLDQVAGTFLTIATIIRTIIFFLYNFYNLKPNLGVLLTIQITFIVIAAVTWNSIIDIFILLSVVVFTYTTWQDNMYVLRIGMILTPIISIIYNILVGAYINIVGEAICLAAAFFAIIYYDILKRSTPIVKRVLYYVKPRRKRKKLRQRLKHRVK